MANKPKLEFLLNVPTTVRLLKNFRNGDGEYGPWFGWGVMHDGVEKTLFADPDLQAKIIPFGTGLDLTITKSQIPGSRQFAWQVGPAGQDRPDPVYAPPNGERLVTHAPPYAPQTPQRANTPQRDAIVTYDRDEYRAERRARAEEALADAEKVMNPEIWSREDVRAMAISFLIDEQHKGIAPPENPF